MKQKIVFFDNTARAVELTKENSSIKFVVLNEVPQANAIREVFKKSGRCSEADKRSVVDKNYPDLRRKFIDFIGRLNIANRASKWWWAYFFTSKNPINTGLFYNLANILLLKSLLNEGSECLAVVTDNYLIIKEMRKAGLLKSFHVTISIKKCGTFGKALKYLTPVLLICKFLQQAYFKILILLFGKRMRYNVAKLNGCIALRTIVTERSFTHANSYKDIYFGDLIDYIEKKRQGALIIIAAFSGNYLKILKKSVGEGMPLITPKEYWISWPQLLKEVFLSLWVFIKPHNVSGETNIYGFDARGLIKNAMRDDINSTAFYSHIELYYSMESFAKEVAVSKLIYPIENRPWERLTILAIRKQRPSCKITGYQHASIGPKHLNFVYLPEEIQVTPVPDEIITMGEITKNILIDECGLPAVKVIRGCALRQAPNAMAMKEKPAKLSNILIVLATNDEEYRETMLFMDRAFYQDNGFNIRVRPHPTIRISNPIEHMRRPGFDFEISDSRSLHDDLKWCDVLIYVSSTVCLEALSMGIPVIYLDVDPYLNRDPLYFTDILKWDLEKPDDMAKIVKEIDGMDSKLYSELQSKAFDHVVKYISPVTEDCLNKFV